jgi:hypothetical protein
MRVGLLQVGLADRLKQRVRLPGHLDVALDVVPALLGQLDAAALRRDGACDYGALVHRASFAVSPVVDAL